MSNQGYRMFFYDPKVKYAGKSKPTFPFCWASSWEESIQYGLSQQIDYARINQKLRFLWIPFSEEMARDLKKEPSNFGTPDPIRSFWITKDPVNNDLYNAIMNLNTGIQNAQQFAVFLDTLTSKLIESCRDQCSTSLRLHLATEQEISYTMNYLEEGKKNSDSTFHFD